MTLDEYQEAAQKTATYGGTATERIAYCSLALAGEAGEQANVVKKALRQHGFTDDAAYVLDDVELVLELGDVLWYVAALAGELGYTLETIAQMNLEKLRKKVLR